MQQALELALDRAEYVIESARQRPPKRKYLSSGRKSIFQKLYDLYIEECEKEPEVKVSINFLCYYNFLNVVEEGNLKELDLNDLYFC